jgi:hypothetical protein
MNAVLRIGSMLMILFLSAPMVCGSCLIVTQTVMCHGPQHDEGVTCYVAQQAVAATKAVAAATPSLNQDYIVVAPAAVLGTVRHVSEPTTLAPLPSNDIYLRTGSLLI